MIVSHVRAAGSVLEEIVARTAMDLAERKRSCSMTSLERRAAERSVGPSLRQSLSGDNVSVIAEVKRASPSKGVFPIEVEPKHVTEAYMAGGAVAISCLTDEPYFHGSLSDLEAVAQTAHDAEAPLPVLRKDFVIDPYQIVEAKAYGADAVLLIAAVLNDEELRDLRQHAESIGLDALVEVHTECELARVVNSGASVIGINNRDLKTLVVDLGVTERLAPLIPAGTIVVSESGISSPDHVTRMLRAGVHGVLVGESLIMQPDRSAALRRLRGVV